ncbi:hypothetical protein Hanom_Chr03g00262201 [Helianthus anomalus]
MYAMYLDVLVYYYKIKSTQNAVAKKEISEDVGGKRRTRSMELDEGTSVQLDAEREGTADEHYAFFAGNDWYGLKRLKQRKKFDFRRAEKAVNEANDSVLVSIINLIYIMLCIYTRIICLKYVTICNI